MVVAPNEIEKTFALKWAEAFASSLQGEDRRHFDVLLQLAQDEDELSASEEVAQAIRNASRAVDDARRELGQADWALDELKALHGL